MAKTITWKRLTHYWPLYLFVLPSALLVGLFMYYPAISAMFHAFYRWNGDDVNMFLGVTHFRRALGVPLYWIVALGVLVFMLANSQKSGRAADYSKKVGGIFAPLIVLAVLVARGVLYEVPVDLVRRVAMAAGFWGGLFALLALFGDRDNENRAMYLISLATFAVAETLRAVGVDPVVAWSGTLAATGLYLWYGCHEEKVDHLLGLRITQSLIAMGMVFWALALYAGGDDKLWEGFAIISILVVANIVKLIPSIATAVVIHRLKSEAANYWYRVLFVVPMIIPGMVYLLLWKFFFEPDSVLNMILYKSGMMNVLMHMDKTFGWGGVFIEAVTQGKPPIWLGSPELVLPAIIIWGFPWVGVVGVLIYLAGLQGIDPAVYEAADLDGVTAFGKFLHIELPLILTQVRINLVLLIIGTLQMYGFILILFGDDGGPNGKLLVPGLYMFRQAFVEQYVGYACAIGLVLFAFILVLTEINNRFVRIDK
jgi:raffinose/stachyose/melibiose transport system permease protein